MMSKPLLFAAAAAFAGCVGEGDVRYSGTVAVTSPDLVTIDNDVQVIADADQPVFYTDSYYWLFRDGGWYRSPDYRSGWARITIDTVPTRLRRIDRPEAYVHYRRHDERNRTVTRENRPQREPYPGQTQQPTRDQQRYPQPAPAPYPNPLPPQQQPPVPDQHVTPDVREHRPPDADRDKATRDAQERAKRERERERDQERADRARDRDDDKRPRDRDDEDRDDRDRRDRDR
jgi:hypothetical protein